MTFESLFKSFLIEYDLMPLGGLNRAMALDTLGLESLHYVELMMVVSDAYPGLEVADIEIDSGVSVGEFIDLIDQPIRAIAK
jgi:hypothetical protein